jgi:DNA processing protein
MTDLADHHYLAAVIRPNLLTPAEANRALACFGSAAALHKADTKELAAAGFSGDRAARLRTAWRYLDPSAEAERLASDGIVVIGRADPGYPSGLLDLADPPPVIFVRGHAAALLTEPRLAVVGTRRLTVYGECIVRLLLDPVVAAGVTVVSGLAYGADAAAHRVSLQAKARTIAVLASGVDRATVGPKANLRLADELIAEGGCLVSERPPGAPADKRAFPQRNRLIAALAPALLLPEAAEQSGSLISVRYALELGREVLAVPGPITSPLSAAPNRLIAEGATPVMQATQILEALGLDAAPPRPADRIVQDPLQAAVLAALRNCPLSTEHLIDSLDETPANILVAITDLETSGLLSRNGGEWAAN